MTATCNEPSLLIPSLAGANLGGTLFGGQAFRWRRVGEEDACVAEGWIGDRPVCVHEVTDGVVVRALDGRTQDLEAVALRYFDAGRDYAAIEQRLLRDRRLRSIGKTVRILRQPVFETVVAFVISANNNIPRISRAIEAICDLAGREIVGSGRTFRSFPDASQLSRLDATTLRRDANLGYRDRYVAEIAQRVASGQMDLESLDELPTCELVRRLGDLPGVGPKVADCIALFAFGRLEVFPVDTWTRRAYSELYLNGETVSDKHIGELAAHRFGPYAGVAQQYIFEGIRARARGATSARRPASRRESPHPKNL